MCRAAILYFQRQDYPNKQLLIIDDGSDAIADLVPADERIRVVRLSRRISVGAKPQPRVRAIEPVRSSPTGMTTTGHAPHRLSYQVDHLLKSAAAICGLKDLLFLDIRDGKAWQYNYPNGQRPWLSGNSLVYTRAFWAAHRFPEINVGEDSRLVWTASPRELTVLPDSTFHVGIIHGKNVSPKQIGGAWWKPHAVDDIRRLLGDDWNAFIGDTGTPAVDRGGARQLLTVVTANPPDTGLATAPGLRQFATCSPAWSTRTRSASSTWSATFGISTLLISRAAVQRQPGPSPSRRLPLSPGTPPSVHPSPRPMAWGKLHEFAIDCMRFALQEFNFETLTIVDSDQLALRPGYSEQLAACLAGRPRVGMLWQLPGPPAFQDANPPGHGGVRRDRPLAAPAGAVQGRRGEIRSLVILALHRLHGRRGAASSGSSTRMNSSRGSSPAARSGRPKK